jgi:hypothetical protein
MYLDDLRKFASESSREFGVDASPCTPSEIDQLEAHLKLTLPTAFREFLLWMGQWRGYFHAIVCTMHQGYQFVFIQAIANDDPPVEYYLEGDEQFRELHAHYSHYLSVLVHEHLARSIHSGS